MTCVPFWERASPWVVTYVNVEQASKVPNVEADPLRQWGRPPPLVLTGWLE